MEKLFVVYHGEEVDELLTKDQLIAKPGVSGANLEQTPILDKVPVQLEHSSCARDDHNKSQPSTTLLLLIRHFSPSG